MSTQVGLFITGMLLIVGIPCSAWICWHEWREGRFERRIRKRRRRTHVARINLAKRRGL